MTVRHTPGPWRYVASIPEDGANCWWLCREGMPRLESEIGCVNGPQCSVTEADARLIAAAPDLLEALQEVLPMLEALLLVDRRQPEPGSVGHKARAAIAKATGDAA